MCHVIDDAVGLVAHHQVHLANAQLVQHIEVAGQQASPPKLKQALGERLRIMLGQAAAATSGQYDCMHGSGL